MQTLKILDLLETAVLSLRLDGVGKESISRPNVDFEIGDKSLVFEISVGESEAFPETETSVRSRRVAAIVVSGRLGEGTTRIDRVAQGLVDLFALYNPKRWKGFASTERVFQSFDLNGGGETLKRSAALVAGVRKTAPGIYDGRVKSTVFIDLDVWEERYGGTGTMD